MALRVAAAVRLPALRRALSYSAARLEKRNDVPMEDARYGEKETGMCSRERQTDRERMRMRMSERERDTHT
jgi:DNA-binding transcriptional regulator YdaS (Cro superfamily)